MAKLVDRNFLNTIFDRILTITLSALEAKIQNHTVWPVGKVPTNRLDPWSLVRYKDPDPFDFILAQ